MLPHRSLWFWFKCAGCQWHGIRHHRSTKCLHCGGDLVREKPATKTERTAQDNQALADHLKVPD